MDRGTCWATVHGVTELDTTEQLTHDDDDDDFLTAFPLCLYPLSPLISNFLCLLFGIQGRSRRLKPFFYINKKQGTERGF